MQAFYFPLFPILGCSLFGSAAGLIEDSKALVWVFQLGPKLFKVGRQTSANMVKPFVLRFAMSAAADTSQRGVNSCYQHHHVIIVKVFILPLMLNGPSRLIIIYLFEIRLILLQPRYLTRVLLFLQWWKLFWQLSSAFLVSSCFKWI